MSNTKTVIVTVEQPTNGNRRRLQTQSASMAVGAFIFMSGGMNLALSVGWNPDVFMPSTEHFLFCWFIGVMAGSILAAPLITVLQKHFYYKLSSLLILASGIIFTSAPNEYNAIIAARYINGIALGFTTVPFLIHTSEIAAKSYRGSSLTTEQYGIAAGIWIQVIYTSSWTINDDFPVNRVHGIIDIIFSVCAFVPTFFVVESPIFYIRKGDDAAALECIRHLQRSFVITDAIRAKLEEYKQYVMQNVNLGCCGSIRVGWAPLIKLFFYRGLVALTFSLPLTQAIILSSVVSMGYTTSWPPILFGLLRFWGALIMIRLYDAVGRKLLSKIALLISACLMIAVGCIFKDPYSVLSSGDMTSVTILLLIYQFLAGMFVPCSSIFLGEAFPLLVKPYFIALTLIVENVVQLIIICTFALSTYNLFVFAVSVGAISLFLFLFFGATMPETRNTTLQEAQARNVQVVYLKFY